MSYVKVVLYLICGIGLIVSFILIPPFSFQTGRDEVFRIIIGPVLIILFFREVYFDLKEIKNKNKNKEISCNKETGTKEKD